MIKSYQGLHLKIKQIVGGLNVQRIIRHLVIFILIILVADQVVAAPPEVNGESFILYDPSSQEMLAGRDVHKKLAPSSTTIVLTVLVALEKGKLKDEVIIGPNPPKEGGAKVYLKEGDKVTLGQLINAALVHSANDAALAIAEHVADSEDKFSEMMNEKAVEIGCKDSNFLNPHGLSQEKHVSSAHDLALISAEAMKNNAFRKVVVKKNYNWLGSEWENKLVNMNKLLWKMPSATGIKSGYSEEAKNTLIGSAKKDDNELICVILGVETEDIFDQAELLLEYGFKNFQSMSFMQKDKAVATLKFEDGRSVELLAARPLNLSITSGDESKIERQVIISKSNLPVKKGEIVGELVVSLQGKEKDSIPLKAKETVKAKFNYVKLILYTLAGIYILQIVIRIYKMTKKKRKKPSRRRPSKNIAE